MVWHFSLRSSL